MTIQLEPGYKLSSKYTVVEQLGSGWEGEVYLVKEKGTQINRTAKVFYPSRNMKNLRAIRCAKRLHTLRHIPEVVHYHHQETITYRNFNLNCLISEYVEGQVLSQFIEKMPKKALGLFQALHIIHALANILAKVHDAGEYHGDLHTDNIFIRPVGLKFHIKIFDFFHHADSKTANQKQDIVDLIKLFKDLTGSQHPYQTLPREIKYMVGAYRTDLILQRYRSIRDLIFYLENFDWTAPLSS